MAKKLKIKYRDFYDVPRIFLTTYKRQQILFDCPFDGARDEYPASYDVFLMRSLSDVELEGSWEHLRNRAIRFLGHVPVKLVKFDETLRREIDAEILDQLSE